MSLSSHPATRNLVASFAGNISLAVINVVFVPVYLRLMGIEAYGLVGVFATLQMIFNILDFGLTPTVNRELARYSAQPAAAAAEARDLVRTLEYVYWSLGLAIGAVTMALAPYIAHSWVKASQLPASTVQAAVMIMAISIALQWPASFYMGGLLGLQKLVLANALRMIAAFVRFAGAAGVLLWVSPTITMFAGWQVVASVAQTALMSAALWRSLPPSDRRAVFQKLLLARVWRFAAAVSGIMLLTLVITQLDKVILSRMLPLDLFGYYTLAGVVSSGLAMFMGSVFTQLYPGLSKVVVRGDESALGRLYHLGCQLMAVIIMPMAITIALFAGELLLLWTGSAVTVEHTRAIVMVLAIGMIAVSSTQVPYALQLAHGWTTLTLYERAIELVVSIPLVIALALRFGAIGGAYVWLINGLAYALVVVPIMHRRLLRGELRRWYVDDMGRPLLASILVVSAGRWWLQPSTPLITIVSVAAVWAIATLAACVSVPELRWWIWTRTSWTSVALEKA